MWWSRALLVVMLAMLGPAGCGFRPLYGERPAGADHAGAELGMIRVLEINDRAGQVLRNGLVQRLSPRGEMAKPAYTLTVKVNSSNSGVAQSVDGSATLGSMTTLASFALMDIEKGTALFSGTSRSITNFRYYGPRYGSVAVERDAEERALTEIADDIRNQVAAYFASRGAGFKPLIGQ
jgi:LPS-assembly lipoprotein